MFRTLLARIERFKRERGDAAARNTFAERAREALAAVGEDSDCVSRSVVDPLTGITYLVAATPPTGYVDRTPRDLDGRPVRVRLL